CAGSLHSGGYEHLFYNSFDVW
nr:immunoglobulin heavy chain junction region [Macaca mulatta]MOV53561.1 immunoglobulin heavy chain junction region [Macaca mulatta]MOV53565.1 immunoglobulin heavy chain junction region [Macaca mulatta]MOV53636.1 immunoglobulin heavy chain junction region [Macaca mulatta]MOV53649.1 immunoglobulin heavy chain junction region [Macaca mulatta]